MLLSWFDAEDAKIFGKSLAQFYIERIPLDATGGKKELIKKQEVLDKMFQQMARFKREHTLNIYKEAQLGNAFKWALKEAGHEPKYVDQLTNELMIIR